VQNIEKLRIYIYMAAAAAEIFINCLRQGRRRRLSRSSYTSIHDNLLYLFKIYFVIETLLERKKEKGIINM
jgi:hypothetical protein